ncbi:hypothetical protein [Pyrococcus kukulkanii]|uniref:hypothetical protein n=1 Tax=Pyrococcus kukulkanii TaxID=1609559 RepID=UPI0035638988
MENYDYEQLLEMLQTQTQAQTQQTPQDEEGEEEFIPGMGTLIHIIDDPELRKEFRWIYREFRLGYLKEHEVAVIRYLLSSALQLYEYQRHYEKKGVSLDLTETIKMILSEAEAIIVSSRSRHGFERKMLATTIQKVEQREEYDNERRLRLFTFLGGGRE